LIWVERASRQQEECNCAGELIKRFDAKHSVIQFSGLERLNRESNRTFIEYVLAHFRVEEKILNRI
jgi:hypothetical protein